MLSRLILIAAVAAAVHAGPLAQPCDKEKCKLPKCRCFDAGQPGNLAREQIPQMVLLTFDDAIQADNYKFYDEAFAGRKNPDGCPIGATYFVAHEYTNYERLHMLAGRGHEIALHSITHETMTEYWKTAPLKTIEDEFVGERETVSHFGNVPKESIKGIRMPFLQMSGNTSFEMLKRHGFKYDCSWPTQQYSKNPIWPYTLDYQSKQDCLIPPCPNEAFPGIWVVPMVDWTDDSGKFCAMVDGCIDVPDTVDGMLAFMIRNFETHYNNTRAPFGFFVHASWFLKGPINFEVYEKFIDYLQSKKEVYIVTIDRMLEWVEKPSPIGNLTTSWPKCQPTFEPNCSNVTCYVKKGEEERVLTQCADCPRVYPWLGNPLGE